MKQLIKSLPLLLIPILAALLLLAVPSTGRGNAIDPIGQGSGADWDKAVRAYEANAAAIAKQLADVPADAWINPDKAEALERLVKAAGQLRSEASIDVLIAQLTFDPSNVMGRFNRAAGPLHIKYPAVGALVEIGMPAVPSLIKAVTDDPKDAEIQRDALKRRSFALKTLRLIYGLGGFGEEIALERLMLEAKDLDAEGQKRLLRLIGG